MFRAIGSAFSKLGKSAAFKGTLAAIGAAAAGEIGARLSGVAAAKGFEPSTQPGDAPRAADAAFGFTASAGVPWGGVAVIAGVVALVFLVASREKKG